MNVRRPDSYQPYGIVRKKLYEKPCDALITSVSVQPKFWNDDEPHLFYASEGRERMFSSSNMRHHNPLSAYDPHNYAHGTHTIARPMPHNGNAIVWHFPRSSLPHSKCDKTTTKTRIANKGVRLMTDNPPPRVDAVRRTLLLLLVLSFVPYSFPDDRKPEMYRGHPLTNEDLKRRELNAFLGGNIQHAPLDLNLEKQSTEPDSS